MNMKHAVLLCALLSALSLGVFINCSSPTDTETEKGVTWGAWSEWIEKGVPSEWSDWQLGTTTYGIWQPQTPATMSAPGTKYREGTRTDKKVKTQTFTRTRTSNTGDTQTEDEIRTINEETRTLSSPTTMSLRETGVIPAGYYLDANGNEVEMTTSIETLPSITGQDVNVLYELGQQNGALIDMKTVQIGNAIGTIENTLPKFASQAETLRVFFDGAEDSYSSKAATFTALKDAQAGIKTEVSSVNGNVSTFDTRINNRINGVLNTFAPAASPERIAFEKYLTAYREGTYLVNRDWQTKEGVVGNNTMAGLGSNFPAALTAIGKTNFTGYGMMARGEYLIDMEETKYTQLMNEIKNDMKTQIVNGLGLTGVANADAMALALINQIQDFEEFRALIDDFKGADALHETDQTNWQYDLDPALNYNYSFTIAQSQTQSSLHLAHIDPKTQFQPDAVKTAYGKPYEQYTGPFTSYTPSRKENEMA